MAANLTSKRRDSTPTVNEGIILERLAGITRGHDELLHGIDRWLQSLEDAAATRQIGRKRTRRKS